MVENKENGSWMIDNVCEIYQIRDEWLTERDTKRSK